MAKNSNKTMYVCSECGYDAPKWFGQCPSCKEWNTMEEIKVSSAASYSGSFSAAEINALPIDQITISD